MAGDRVSEHHAQGVATWAGQKAQTQNHATSSLQRQGDAGPGNSPSPALPPRTKAQGHSS